MLDVQTLKDEDGSLRGYANGSVLAFYHGRTTTTSTQILLQLYKVHGKGTAGLSLRICYGKFDQSCQNLKDYQQRSC